MTILALLLALAPISPARALDERIIHDPYTGLSIGGYDPVAYFSDGMPRMGTRENEVVLGDTYWHFINKGNADAFRDHPEVYIPAYGGYSPAGVSHGLARPGSPGVFTIYRSRLYFFTDADERAAFLADPAAAIAAADAGWPAVLQLLAY